MKKKMIALLLCVTMAAACLSGCGNEGLSEARGNAAEEQEESDGSEEDGERLPLTRNEDEDEEEEEAADEDYDKEEMELIKYNIFISLNDYILEVVDNINAYYTVVDTTDEFALLPDADKSYGYGIHYLNMDILDDAAEAVKYEPVLGDLDDLAKEVLDPMRVLMDAFNQINRAGSSIADNQYALPKELHPIIQEQADIFYEIGEKYCDAVSEYADAQVAQDEIKMQEEGNLIMYYSSHAITVTNSIFDECEAQDVNDYNLTELDLTKIQPLYDELVETVAGYNAAVSDNDQLIKESLSNSSPFDGLLDSLIQSMDYMMQAAQGSGIEDPELEPLGSLRHLNNVLNSTIDRYNSVFVD